jgi:hypothetical protein
VEQTTHAIHWSDAIPLSMINNENENAKRWEAGTITLSDDLTHFCLSYPLFRDPSLYELTRLIARVPQLNASFDFVQQCYGSLHHINIQ